VDRRRRGLVTCGRPRRSSRPARRIP